MSAWIQIFLTRLLRGCSLCGDDTRDGRTRHLDLYILGNPQVTHVALNTLYGSVNPAGGEDLIALFERVEHFLGSLPLLRLRSDDEEVKNQGEAAEQEDVEHRRLAAGTGLEQSNREHLSLRSFVGWGDSRPARSGRTS